jgi:hypothetical protein
LERLLGNKLEHPVHVPKRENPIVNRLSKTKEEREVDHEAERVERIKKENAVKRAAAAQKVLPLHFFILYHILFTPHIEKG